MLFQKENYQLKSVSHNNNLIKRVILDNNSLPNLLQFAIAEFDSGEIIKPHSHVSMSEVFYVLSGKVQVIYNSENYIAKVGDSFLIRANNIHKLYFIENTELLYFSLLDQK